ncbi:MAG: sensor histidine kinase [Dehalococcoidia bacterium]
MNEPPVRRFLGVTIPWTRWSVLAALLLITLIAPMTGRLGIPTWALVLAFAAYNLAVDLLRPRLSWLMWYGHVALLDLPAIAVVYSLGGEASGPLFNLFLLAVICAAASMTLAGSVVFTAITALVAAAISLSYLEWPPTTGETRELGARLVVLSLVGVGMAILSRRLALEQATGRAAQLESERLAELNRLRSEFISTISHDLRTPLTATRAGLGMLETSMVDRLQPDEKDLLGNARRNVDRLALLIDDLLAFNQLEAGTLQLDREPLDLRAVVAGAMATVHPLIREKGQTLEIDLPEPLLVEGDVRRLEQVVVNLLANAHRHTPAGTRITTTGRATPSELRLSVQDTGPGIPADELQAIFQRFYRLTPSEGGSGLGLAIAKGIVELHGGRIWAESRPGEGTTFHLLLPREERRPT